MPLVFGNTSAFRKLMLLADEYAKTPWPTLILGETGVGKELLAQHLHQRSPRSGAPFIAVNCSAIPSTLFESEFFGYERGAFSGALNSHRGLLRAAHGGTLFLDEIGELDACAQAKLLRWLDSGEVRALGSTRTEKIQARLLAATNVDLYRAVAEGSFRLDLLERLSVLTLKVPPLRDRKDDILLISYSLLEQMKVPYRREDLQVLVDFSWPGNVRQLRNILIRAIARGPIQREILEQLLEEEKYLVDALAQNKNHDILTRPLAEIEKRVILERIRYCRGNKKQAAKELGIAKSTLHDKIRRWKEESPGSGIGFGRAVLGGGWAG